MKLRNGFVRKLFAIAVALLWVIALPQAARAASQSDLAFTLNSAGDGYAVSLRNKTASGELVIPDSYKGLPVTAIYEYGFWGCTGLTSIIIPDSVTHIGDAAFRGCTGLTTVTIGSGVTEIGGYAFVGCTGLTGITLPDSVTTIGSKAFSESGLTSITIPDSVTSLDAFAFSECKGLTTAVIGNGVAEIGSYAFQNCTALTAVTIGDGVKTLQNGVFSGCTALTSVRIPSSITHIGEFAFQNCSSLSCNVYSSGKYLGNDQNPYVVLIGVTDRKMSDYEIHRDTKILFGNVFFQCHNVTVLTVPEGVIQIDGSAFSNCNSVSQLRVAEGNAAYHSDGNCIIETATKTLIAGCKESVIPGDGSVTVIGPEAFSYCTGLADITIPDTVTAIGEKAFSDCRGLTQLTIPDSVTAIGSHSFTNCYSLTTVTLPDGLTVIDSFAFAYCKNLTGIRIPEGVTEIGNYAFQSCEGLTGIQIPKGVTAIGSSAFKNCTGVTGIILPASVQTVKDSAFQNCDKLTDVFYTGTEDQWNALSQAVGTNNTPLLNATVHYNYIFQPSSLVVFVDRTDLRVAAGETITLRVMVQDPHSNYADPSGITFQLTDSSLVDIGDSGFEADCFYLQLRGVNPGTTTVTFSDTNTGFTAAVPIAVYASSHLSYTISNVPEISSYGLTANFANFNGMFVDSFAYQIQADQSARVTFDVYNTNFSYGLVEVYTQDGQLYNAVLIDKMEKNNASIKKVYWDGTVCFVQALVNQSLDDYRGGFVSKRTPVRVDIPQNGYIKITCDPTQSDAVALVNYAHMLVSALSLVGEANGFDPDDVEFPKELTRNLLVDTAFEQLRKDGSKAIVNLVKDTSKKLTISAATVGDFADTLTQNLMDLKLMPLITKSLTNTGVDIGENALTKLLGQYGVALKTVFIIGKCENLVLEYNDAAYTIGGGAITIQNQSGGLRAATQIVLKSEADFDPDVALQAYRVELDEEFLEFVRQADRETYEVLTQSICHTYSISLLKGGQKVQHSDNVTVYIPIPEDLRVLSLGGNVKVYRIEEDGSLTDMDAVVEDGCMRFVTDHFSLYVLSGKGENRGDIDGNGTVDQDDVVYLLLHTMFGEGAYPLGTRSGDVDRNGTVDQDDVVYLLLHTMFGENAYPLK